MKKMALIMVLAALVCWLPGQALATTDYSLTIYDQATGVTGSWGSSFSSPIFTTGTETATGSASDGYFAFNTGKSVSLIFTEAGSGASDFLTVYTDSSGTDYFGRHINFKFESDGAATFAADVAALNNPCYVAETGSLQDVSNYFNALFNCTDVCIKLQSCEEPSAVPIPPSALLLGSGLLGLVGIGWRKRG